MYSMSFVLGINAKKPRQVCYLLFRRVKACGLAVLVSAVCVVTCRIDSSIFSFLDETGTYPWLCRRRQNADAILNRNVSDDDWNQVENDDGI